MATSARARNVTPTETTYGKIRDEDEDGEDEHMDERTRNRKVWVRRLDTIWVKINALFWIAASCYTIWFTNFFRVIWEHPGVRRPYLNLGFTFLGFNIALLIYLTIYLETYKKIKIPWDTYEPRAIPALIIAAVLSFVLFTIALWPVWGIFIVLIQMIFFMGFLNSGHFLPGEFLGTLCMFAIFFGAFFTSEYIPHEGFGHYPHYPHPETSLEF